MDKALLILLLLAQMTTPFEDWFAPKFNEDEIRLLDKMKVGEGICQKSKPDSCGNTCTSCFTKTGPDTVSGDGSVWCTLLACPLPEYKFK